MLTRRQRRKILEQYTKGVILSDIIKDDPTITRKDAAYFLEKTGLHAYQFSFRISYAILFFRALRNVNPDITWDEAKAKYLEDGHRDSPIGKRIEVGRFADKARRNAGIRLDNDIKQVVLDYRLKDLFENCQNHDFLAEIQDTLEKNEIPSYFNSSIAPPLDVEQEHLIRDIAYLGKDTETIANTQGAYAKRVPGWLLFYANQSIESRESANKVNIAALSKMYAEEEGSADTGMLTKVPRLNIDYKALFAAFDFSPHIGQKDFFDIYYNPEKNARYCVLLAGRRWGKTVSCSILAAAELLQPKSTVCVIAPNYRNAEIIFMHTYNLLANKMKIEFKEQHIREKKLRLINGALFIVVSAENAGSIRGYEPSLTIFEEAAMLANGKKIFEEIIRPACSTATSDLGEGRGRAVFISTPVYGSFLEEYYYKGLSRAGQQDGWYSWRFPSDVNPIVLKSGDMEIARREMSDDAFRREYLAEWASPDGTVFDEFSVETHLMSYDDFQERLESKNIDPSNIEIILGIDPGFTHPFAVVLVAYLQDYDEYWVLASYKESAKSMSVHNTNIQDLLDSFSIKFEDVDHIFYDHAAPQAIEDLSAADDRWWANPAIKSVESGRNFIKELLLQKKLFIVEENCDALVSEFLSFSFTQTRSGDLKIQKVKDDALDALRYAVYSHAVCVRGSAAIGSSKKEIFSRSDSNTFSYL